MCIVILPGQYYDEETGLHYNYFRYYDPKTGRYLRPDPIGLAGKDPNLYGYALNNPINLKDSKGLFTGIGSITLPSGGMAARALLGALSSPAIPVVGGIAYVYYLAHKQGIQIPSEDEAEDIMHALLMKEASDLYNHCLRLYILCDEQQWKGDCDQCFQYCKAQGEWDFLNCPPGSCRW